MQERANVVKVESLAEYVRRIIDEKKLTLRDVARRSDRRITHGYVGGIVQGRHTNPSVEKLKALAAGLQVDEDEIFSVARGISVVGGPEHTLAALHIVTAIALSPDADEVLEFVEELMTLSASDRSSAINLLGVAIENKSIDPTGKVTFEGAEQKLEHVDSSRFSVLAWSKLNERVAEYIAMLTTEAMKLSRRHQADAVSVLDVERASEYLFSDSRRRIFRRAGTIGGLLLGASLSNFLSMTAATVYNRSGVLISACLGTVGAFLVALNERRD